MACTTIPDDRARLACFDREVAGQLARKEPHTVAGPTAAATPVAPPPPLSEEQKMGLTPGRIAQLEKPPSAPPPPEQVTVTIQRIAVNGDGRQVFELATGQIWRQVEPDARFLVHPGDSVVISRGVADSYFMSFGKHRNTRVSRVR